MTMSSDIHLSERADITNSCYFDGEITIKIDNLLCFVSYSETQQEGCQQWTHQFLK